MNLRFASLFPALSLLTASLSAQTLIQRFDGVAAQEAIGRCVASAGDVNADGYDDVLVGGDWVDSTARDAGRVFVYDGQALRNGQAVVLWQWDGNSIGDFFGWSCDGAGDVDGDGHDDIVVGAYGDDPANTLDAGSAYVYSGRTGQMIHDFPGSTVRNVGSERRFGRAVAGAGDVNGDGYADVIVGAFTDDVVDAQGNMVFGDSGSATVFSGRDGSVLFKYEGTATLQFAGFSVAGAGDVDGDGWDDVLVGVVGDGSAGTLAGTALLLAHDPNQPNGHRLIRRYDALAAGDLQGVSVANAGDVDGDFVPDQVVGAVLANPGGTLDAGAARVYSGATGALIREFGGLAVNELQGLSVDGAGDVDGDGLDDVIVGAILANGGQPVSGQAYVFSVTSGATLMTLGGQGIADAFGWSVAGAGDVDGDGFADVLVGAPFADPSGRVEGGSAYLFSGIVSTRTPWRIDHVGTACPDANGRLATATIDGKPRLASTIQFGLRAAPANGLVFLNIATPFASPVGLGAFGFQPSCTAYVETSGFIASSLTNAVGVVLKTPVFIPNSPVFLGAQPWVQWICADAGVTGGYTFSAALQLTIGN
jgi:hypothetical protein